MKSMYIKNLMIKSMLDGRKVTIISEEPLSADEIINKLKSYQKPQDNERNREDQLEQQEEG